MCANLISSYGSTEVGTVASAPAHLIADIAGAVGHVTPGISVEIVDQSGKVLPVGREGIVRIRSPHNANGYVGNPEESRNAFRDGCFYPGDLGSLTRDGVLVISGREKTRLNVGGDKVKPEILEEVLTSFGAIGAAAVFSAPNELGLEQVHALTVAGSPIDQKALQAHCEARLPRAFVPVRFITVDQLPRNAMGKIERHCLADLAKGQAS
jgi:acyl-coenzyme A synthetase/AMP-(fatty) acid ligase